MINVHFKYCQYYYRMGGWATEGEHDALKVLHRGFTEFTELLYPSHWPVGEKGHLHSFCRPQSMAWLDPCDHRSGSYLSTCLLVPGAVPRTWSKELEMVGGMCRGILGPGLGARVGGVLGPQSRLSVQGWVGLKKHSPRAGANSWAFPTPGLHSRFAYLFC